MACKHLHIVNNFAVSETGGSVTLSFANPVNFLKDEERFCMKIPCGLSVPKGYEGYIVLVTYNGTSIPLMNKYGNPAKFGELRKGCVITGYYGETESHVISQIPMTYNCRCNNVL